MSTSISAIGSVVPKSPPTIAPTPTRPINSPSRPNPVIRSAPPVASARAVPTRGTPAMSRPVSELDRCCSADPSITHGIAISTTAKATSQRQRARIGRMSTRRSAIGSRMAVASPVRRRTSRAGEISATAIRMNRYGIPQITDISANRTSPRRVTTPPPFGSSSTDLRRDRRARCDLPNPRPRRLRACRSARREAHQPEGRALRIADDRHATTGEVERRDELARSSPVALRWAASTSSTVKYTIQ